MKRSELFTELIPEDCKTSLGEYYKIPCVLQDHPSTWKLLNKRC